MSKIKLSRDLLSKVRVVGVDLDDTLHYFRTASGAASLSILQQISDETMIALAMLQECFSTILQQDQSGHFTVNQSSSQYRQHRFERLMAAFGLSGRYRAADLVDRYDHALATCLAKKPGAEALLKLARRMGKDVVVITEGPYDAQEKTLHHLGLLQYVDEIHASSQWETSKTDGLFELTLASMGVSPNEMLYVGDNPERDYGPATDLGVLSFLLDEDNHFPGHPNRVASLNELVAMMVAANDAPDNARE